MFSWIPYFLLVVCKVLIKKDIGSVLHLTQRHGRVSSGSFSSTSCHFDRHVLFWILLLTCHKLQKNILTLESPEIKKKEREKTKNQIHSCWVKIELSSIIQQSVLRANPAKMERIKLWVDQKIGGGLGFCFDLEAELESSENGIIMKKCMIPWSML